MVKTNKLVAGLIAGVAVGAVAGLLFAPKPGKDSRKIVTSRTYELNTMADELRNKVEGILSRRKSKEEQPVMAEALNGHVNGTV